ncbi:hypothetical protein Pcinc_025824 [Petrolisthes cinctipes]|uniref:Uncharacterized protein n=1 Tax=Petrolisthes cinctipes TaxID=88211 RepID=A0AAE1F809_PETCI|nr:hypothetical protein Pcinc_025824 [Petrolisthes cinctipes]
MVNVTALPFNPFWDERVLADGTKHYSGTDYKTVSTIGNILNFSINVVPTSSWAEFSDSLTKRCDSDTSPFYKFPARCVSAQSLFGVKTSQRPQTNLHEHHHEEGTEGHLWQASEEVLFL